LRLLLNLLFAFEQLAEDYPKILCSNNIWIIGIAQEPLSQDYYLVFYYDLRSILDRLLKMINDSQGEALKFIPYEQFREVEELGSGGYGIVYTAKNQLNRKDVVLKRYKRLDRMPELFVSEVSELSCCICPRIKSSLFSQPLCLI
jgi:hypothetical protein